MTPLRDYQQKALSFLENGGSLLALDMGLGKTRIMLEFAKREKARRVLIFCPASVRLAWEAETQKWWSDGPPPVIVEKPDNLKAQRGIFLISYDRMSRGDEFAKEIAALATKEKFDVAFCDEAHMLKSITAKRTKAIYGKVRPCVKRMVIASGTPAPNHSGELYTSLRALAPERIAWSGTPMTLMQFEDRFCKVDVKFFGGRAIRVITGSQNTAQLRERLDGFMLRMTKKEVLPELPPLDFVRVPVEPSLEGLDPDILEGFDSILDATMDDDDVLRALQNRDEHIARVRSALGLAKTNAAASYLLDFLDDNRRKIVVWGLHHVVIDRMVSRLGDFNPVKIDGRSTGAERKQAVDRFLNDDRVRVFVGNINAAGTGLTLIGPNCECSDCFFVESSYTPGDNLQAAARIHRLGQNDGVLARVFTARRTIDDRIQAIITRKTNELAEIFG